MRVGDQQPLHTGRGVGRVLGLFEQLLAAPAHRGQVQPRIGQGSGSERVRDGLFLGDGRGSRAEVTGVHGHHRRLRQTEPEHERRPGFTSRLHQPRGDGVMHLGVPQLAREHRGQCRMGGPPETVVGQNPPQQRNGRPMALGRQHHQRVQHVGRRRHRPSLAHHDVHDTAGPPDRQPHLHRVEHALAGRGAVHAPGRAQHELRSVVGGVAGERHPSAQQVRSCEPGRVQQLRLDRAQQLRRVVHGTGVELGLPGRQGPRRPQCRVQRQRRRPLQKRRGRRHTTARPRP